MRKRLLDWLDTQIFIDVDSFTWPEEPSKRGRFPDFLSGSASDLPLVGAPM
jgi:galactose-1-phosphate uridylyltransferase